MPFGLVLAVVNEMDWTTNPWVWVAWIVPVGAALLAVIAVLVVIVLSEERRE